MNQNNFIMKVISLLIIQYFLIMNVSFAQNTKLKSTDATFVCLVTDLDKIAEENATVIIKSEDKTITKQGITDVDGKFIVVVPNGKTYHVVVKKFGYDFKFTSKIPKVSYPVEFVQNYVINMFLDFKRSYGLENIHFEAGKWDLKEECKPAIDSLLNTFKTNQRFRAEIAGYTDNVGNDAENMRLSQRRADAIRQYLISKGIQGGRILAKGYGEKFSIAPNDTEEGRSKNRRTEVKVIQE